jgi:hypothetical protein
MTFRERIHSDVKLALEGKQEKTDVNNKLENLEKAFEKAGRDLTEFTEMRNALRREVMKLEGEFVEDKSLLDALSEARAKLGTLENSVNNLTDERDRLEKELAAARAVAKENALLEISKEKAAAAADSANDYIKLRSEFDKVLDDYGEKLYTKLQEFRGNQQAYRQSISDIEPDIKFRQSMGADESEKLSRIIHRLEEIGTTDEQIKLGTADRLNIPASDWAMVVEYIFRIKIAQKEREAREERYKAMSK